VAINGGFGTLSELAFALQLQKPVVGLGTWDVSDNIVIASDPDDAMQKLTKLLT
jgi:predicted Rossmann-fold nucleotide-binding protein